MSLAYNNSLLAQNINVSGTNTTVSGLLVSTSGDFTDSLKVNSINVSISGHNHFIGDIINLQSILDTKQASGNYSLDNHQHIISDVSGLQSSLDSKQPSGNYANVDHNHTSLNITDFVSSVSDLIPVKNITGDIYASITSTTGNFTISITGLQPSGNYAAIDHEHNSSNIVDFNSSVSGLLPVIANSGDNRVLTSTGTSTGINAEDSLTFNGSSLAVPSGSVTTPSITAIGDSDTGLYFAGSDSISISTSGNRRLNINPAGYIGIGSNGINGITLSVSRQIAGSTASHGIVQQGVVQSDVTNNVVGVYNIMNIAAAGFTLPLYSHFTSASNPLGSGSTVTTQIGYHVSSSMTGASSNLGFRGALASAAGNWNLYLDGAAQNFIFGNVGIGTGKSIPSCALDVNGLIAANSGNFTSNLQIGNNNLTNTNTTNIVNSANIYLWSNFR